MRIVRNKRKMVGAYIIPLALATAVFVGFASSAFAQALAVRKPSATSSGNARVRRGGAVPESVPNSARGKYGFTDLGAGNFSKAPTSNGGSKRASAGGNGLMYARRPGSSFFNSATSKNYSESLTFRQQDRLEALRRDQRRAASRARLQRLRDEQARQRRREVAFPSLAPQSGVSVVKPK